MPDFAENLFTVVTGAPMLVMLGIALVALVRRRDPLILFCFIGGGLAALFEPVADILSGPPVGGNAKQLGRLG